MKANFPFPESPPFDPLSTVMVTLNKDYLVYYWVIFWISKNSQFWMRYWRAHCIFFCTVFVHCCASGEQTEITNWIFLEKLAMVSRLNILLQKDYTDHVPINQTLCIQENHFILSCLLIFPTCVILFHNCLRVGLPYGTHKGLILEFVRLLNQVLLTQEGDTMID